MVTGAIVTKPATVVNTRLWEIDTARGVAVLLMVYFHLMWDMQFFGLSNVDVFSIAWQRFARGIGSTFMFLMGLSLTLAANRGPMSALSLFSQHIKRGLQLLIAAAIVTIVTYFAVGDSYVRFGILHLAGISIILAYPFVRAHSSFSLISGLSLILVWYWLDHFHRIDVTTVWLLPFGLVPSGMDMVDYYPLIPWFGTVLLGIAAGQFLYPHGQRRIVFPDMGQPTPMRILRWMGRHSLAIYLLHQPLLIALVGIYVYLSTGTSPR